MVTLNLYRIKEVGSDYIVVADEATEVRITFAGGSGFRIGNDDTAFTKEENAQFFKDVRYMVGLETPVVPLKEPRTINLFLDHFVDLFGLLRSIPFPFPVSRMEVSTPSRS